MKKLLILGLLTVSSFAYTNCMACHNGGYKENLNKYTPAEIRTMLNQYKSGQKSGMMSSIVNAMNEADIKDASIKFGKK